MAQTELKVSINDAEVVAAFDRMANGAEKVQGAVDGIGEQGKAAFTDIAKAVGTGEAAIVDAAKAIQQYKAAMSENNRAITDTEKAISRQRLELAKLQRGYSDMAKESAKAVTTKQRMDALTKSISDQTKEVEILRLENEQLNEQISKAGGTSQLAAYQVQNLTAQFTDLAVQIGSGQDFFRPLLQQGPQIAEALGEAGNAARFFGNQAKTAAGKLLTTRGAAAALGLGLVAMIAIPVISFLTKSQKASEFFADKLAFVSGVVKEITGRLFIFGESLVGLIAGTKTWGDVSAAAGELVAGGYAAAGREAQAFAAVQRDIARQQEAFIVREQVLASQADERRRVAGNENESYRDRIQAVKEAAAIEKQLEDQRLKFARAEFDRIAREGTLADGVATNLEEQRVKQAEIIKLQAQAAAREFADQQTIISLRKQASDETKRQREEFAAFNAEVQKLRDRLKALQDSDLTGVAAIRAQGDAVVEELARTEAEYKRLYAARGVAFNLQDEFNQLREISSRKTEEKISAFIISSQDRQRVAQSEAIRQNEADQQAALQARLDNIQREGEALAALQSTELAQLGTRKAALREQLSIAQDAFINGLTGSDTVTAIRRQLATVETEYNKLANASLTGVAAFKAKLFAALGLDENSRQILVQQLGNLAGNLTGLFDTINQGRIDALNQEIAALDKTIADYEDKVEEQRKRQQDGLANNLAIVEAALAEENKARAAALRERAQEEAKAARLKLAQDAIQQASDIVSATTALIATQASRGLVGLVGAIGGLALIARLIAQGRNIARQARPQFREGTEYLVGPSHERGGIPIEAEGGERILSAKLNRKLPAGLSNNALVDIASRAVSGAYTPTVPTDLVTTIVSAYVAAQAQERKEQLEALERGYREAAKEQAAQMISYWRTRPIEYLDEDGNRVTQFERGGTTVIQRQIKTDD